MAATSDTRPVVETDNRLDLIGGGRAGLGVAVVAVVLSVVSARAVRWEDVDGYGLISALPPLYWLAVAMGVGATVLLFRAAQTEVRFASAVPMMWLAILHTAPQLAHQHVRFPTVWTHLGFVRVIEETGAGRIDLDARFAWPGFFGVFAAPFADMPMPLLELLLRLWPTYITGGTAILVASLARRSYPNVPLIGSLSALAYVLLAWTGQDYFSPQSSSYLYYIAILVLLESGPLRVNPAWSSALPFLSRFATAGGDRPMARSAGAFVALVILSMGAIVSHPLGPFFICTGLVILGLYGRRTAWRLLVIVGSVYLVWFLISAQPFWQSRVDELLANVGRFGSVIDTGTAERVSTASASRSAVTRVRTIIGLSTFGYVLAYGTLMATDRFKHLRPVLPLAPLAGVPALAVALQAYGGEIIIRVLLFTLPMASILVGRLLASARIKYVPVAAAALSLVLIPVFLLARYGNEAFEMSIAQDRAAIEAAYEVAAAYTPADDKTLFVADNSFLPWRDEGIGRNYYVEQPLDGARREWDECGIADLDRIRQELDLEQVLVVFTVGQLNWEIEGRSRPVDQVEKSVDWLVEREGTEILFNDGGAWVLRIDTTVYDRAEAESCSSS